MPPAIVEICGEDLFLSENKNTLCCLRIWCENFVHLRFTLRNKSKEKKIMW
jgi:hypothetical protein